MARAFLLLYGLGVIGLVGAYLRTGDRRWLRWSGRLLVAGLVAALVFFVVLAIQQW